MKALTVWQPWATLIANKYKPFEFRSWRPPASIIGKRIAIHAGARPVKLAEIMHLRDELDGDNKPALLPLSREFLMHMNSKNYPLSCFVCTAVVGKPMNGFDAAESIGCTVNDSDREGTFNWAWPMEDVKQCYNHPYRGAQGLWSVPEGLLE